MSTFQSRTQEDAFSRLLPHVTNGDADGIQLTPGNLPSPRFESQIRNFIADGGVVRFHQGFSWTHYRRPVLDLDGNPLDIGPDHSIHPPRTAPRHAHDRGPFVEWDLWLRTVLANDLLVETMYPGYALGNGKELESAMDAGVRMCLDIAHLSIQDQAGVLPATTLHRLLEYDRICEVHISHSRVGKDTHSPLEASTPWLGWAP